MWRGTLALMLLLVPVLAVGQSLGDVARREKERRKDNRRRGEKPTLVIGEIGQTEEGEEPTPVLGTAASQEQRAEPEQRTSNETDRAQQEMEWRRRSSEARERLKEAPRAPQQTPFDHRCLLRGREQRAGRHFRRTATNDGCAGQGRAGCRRRG